MATKKCSKCGIEKDTTEFHSAKRNRDGLRGWCKSCVRDYAQTHKDKNNESKRRNAYKHKEYHKEYVKKWKKTESYKKWWNEYKKTSKYKEMIHRLTTSEEHKRKVNEKRRNNIEEYRIKERERERKMRENPQYRAFRSCRARLGVILKRYKTKKCDRLINLIGCSPEFLFKYLESQWRDGMTWDNYGLGRGKWVIDHIIPCEQFKPFTPELQKQCFHYTNLRPLWWEENAAKSDKLDFVL